jgi:tetraprenyl-beta-curcumene synthase
MRSQGEGRLADTAQFVEAAGRYWLGVFPLLERELRIWRSRATRIGDPRLREVALDAQRSKRRGVEGAVAFAAFAPRAHRSSSVVALSCYQLIFDYLDCVAEQPSADPIANGRQLNQALLATLEPDHRECDYFALTGWRDDGGYLEQLIQTCRAALAQLPSYRTLLPVLRSAAGRVAVYQTLNHGDADGSHAAFSAWARAELRSDTGLRWWESGAAAGTSLAVLALIGAAADPAMGSADAAAVRDAYHPWMCALHTLLDALLDRQEDRVLGHRNLLDYYSSADELADRIDVIAAEAHRQLKPLRNSASHTMILAAMASLYLAQDQSASARLVGERVRAQMGSLAAPTMLVMQIRGLASRIGASASLRGRSDGVLQRAGAR